MTTRKQEGEAPSAAELVKKPRFEQALEFAQTQVPAPAPLPAVAPVAVLAAAVPLSATAPQGEHPARAALVQAWSLMPNTPEAQVILRKRAELIARAEGTLGQAARETYIRFRLGPTELYGIAYRYMEELIHYANVARVPCSPAWVAGVTNYRGELLTVLDPKQFLRTEKGELGEHARILVLRADGVRAGLAVDEVEGEGEYASAALARPLASAGVSNPDYVQGIHEGRVTILNIAALLADPALRVDAAA